MSFADKLADAIQQPFGTVFADEMSIAWFRNDQWTPTSFEPVKPISLHPGSHVLHYASTCFEGIKVHRHEDGSIHAFRLDKHFARMKNSARMIHLPFPSEQQWFDSLIQLVSRNKAWVPSFPGSLYLRPTLIGTQTTIGAASAPSKEACFYTLLSPVGDYFKGGLRPLKIVLETERQRTSLSTGMTKAGGNYAAALNTIMEAKAKYGVDQVLFAPNDDVQETGAANFLMLNDRKLITKALDDSFLHGVTRDSLLTLAREMGYEVEERPIGVAELLEFIKTGEAALSGTAAVLAPVGTFLHKGQEYPVGNGGIGANTLKLRDALIAIQRGLAPDTHGWLKPIA